ncbi:ComEA family DNA-binding protein [Herbiconiux sp. SYSU D00978]|uniref:ComEA family DNA-binding protein n=1 Tax=Herbiconiux sp. SYSU D00978 TaxID=2812562 RepID=UPI001A9707B0|nr:helix-hairpin-helix domain-containing protein [Herbiconiux sp. SYSU D00978]
MSLPTEPPRARGLRLGAGAAVVLVLVAVAVAVLVTATRPTGQTTTVAPPTTAAEPSAGPSGVLYVHILGEVAAPGLYEVPAGARAVDVVAAAGGFTDAADQAQLNLARFVVDGEQILVPAVGAEPPPSATGAGGESLVRLNAADLAELDTLPGVGPTLAQRIIDYRDEHGGFGSVDELKDVPGIGEKTFAELEPLVTL